MIKVIGIDGCRAGWFGVIHDADGWRYTLLPTLAGLLAAEANYEYVFIDIPIGLADNQKRQCDQLARRKLSPHRHSSVFSTPARDAVYAPDYQTACEINAQQTGSKLTKQTWNICPKIREVDTFLRQHPDWQPRIYESHPEVAFASLNNHQPLATRKKSIEGQQQRLALLDAFIENSRRLYKAAMTAYPRNRLQPDDILDAMVLAVMADRAGGGINSLPAAREKDRYGLPMRIVYT